MRRILFIGDIVGRPGRQWVYDRLPDLRKEREVDLVVANAENAAGGSGLNARIAGELKEAGVDAITLGDHVWDQRGFDREIQTLDYVCRPANLPVQCPGRRYLIVEADGWRLGVFTVLGRNFMGMKADCPFLCADELLTALKKETDATLVEIHAEATSEKVAFGWFLDGRVAAVMGTHTHQPTADGRVLPRGTAYLTDAGMSGPYESVLGREIQPVVTRFLDGMPRRFEVAQGDVRLCGALIEVNEKSGAATAFERVELCRDDEKTGT